MCMFVCFAERRKFEAYECYIGWDKLATATTPVFLSLSLFSHFQPALGVLPHSVPSIATRDSVREFVALATADLTQLVKAHAVAVSQLDKASEKIQVRFGKL